MLSALFLSLVVMQEILTSSDLFDSTNNIVKVCSMLTTEAQFFSPVTNFFTYKSLFFSYAYLTQWNFFTLYHSISKTNTIQTKLREIHGILLGCSSHDYFLPCFIYLCHLGNQIIALSPKFYLFPVLLRISAFYGFSLRFSSPVFINPGPCLLNLHYATPFST